MFVVIARSYGEKQTTGCWSIYDEDTEVFQCRTLELPYLQNHKNISCIPEGEYSCERITHRKFGVCWLVNDVPGRSGIIVHSGNFASERIIFERAIERGVRQVDTLGCILTGLRHYDINNDGNLDVADSRLCMDMLRVILPQKFKIIIR